MCVPRELNPRPFVLLTQFSTTEPQEHLHLVSRLIQFFTKHFYINSSGEIVMVAFSRSEHDHWEFFFIYISNIYNIY